jgi:hypothetical protein
MDWEFEPHAILLRKERKEAWWVQRKTGEEWRDEIQSSQVQGRTELE